jgi:hypothetical protein
MPTIQLGRLQAEAAQLSEQFPDPAAYVKELERLLETYASHVHRQGRIKGLRPVLHSFEVPPPVLKRLELEMALQARQQPQTALAVADALWARRSMETRLLAVRLLGAAPAPAPEATRRLEAWAAENREELIAPELHERGALHLVHTYPDETLAFAGRLLAAADPRLQALGLGVLQTLLAADGFGNLPLIFGLLSPVSEDPPRKLRPYLAELLSALAQRSPKETSYFLQQRLAANPGEGTQWVARQAMKSLPEDAREALRASLETRPSTDKNR